MDGFRAIMVNLFPFMVVLLGCLLWTPATGQTVLSNKGVYLVNSFNLSSDRNSLSYLEVYVGSFEDTKIAVTNPAYDGEQIIDLDAGNDRVFSRTYDRDLAAAVGRRVTRSGIIVRSNSGVAIDVDANKMESGTTAAYRAYPITKNSNEFFIPAYTTETGSVFNGGLAVAGLQDGTCVEIYRVQGNNYQRQELIHLDSLDVYTDLGQNRDYTGYFVNSTRPLAVYGGHECAKIPEGVSYCDAVVEQVPAVVEWGSEFIVGPIGGRSEPSAGYEIRVIAGSNDTQIEFTSPGMTTTDTIDRGEFSSYEAASTRDSVHIVCSVNCLVVQYNRGYTQVTGETTPTDPFMTIIPPLDHYENRMRFPTMSHLYQGNIETSTNYITIVSKTADIGGLRLDGNVIPNSAQGPLETGWTAVTDKPDYSTRSLAISTGYHSIVNVDQTAEFMTWVYGHGSGNTAYGFAAGYKITDEALSDTDIFEVVEPATTAEPVTTREPWVLGNWTEDFAESELPMYGVRYAGEISVISREQKVIEKTCSDGYRDFFVDRRLATMATKLTQNVDSICPGLMGSTIQLMSSDAREMFYTEYTRGYLSYIVLLIGSPTTSFRQIRACSNELKTYVNNLSNWPGLDTTVDGVVTSYPVTDETTYLVPDGDSMSGCDPVKLGILSADVEFEVVREAWICNGEQPEDILVLIGSASNMATVTWFRACALALAVYLTVLRLT